MSTESKQELEVLKFGVHNARTDIRAKSVKVSAALNVLLADTFAPECAEAL